MLQTGHSFGGVLPSVYVSNSVWPRNLNKQSP